jgi:hypothetical protein
MFYEATTFNEDAAWKTSRPGIMTLLFSCQRFTGLWREIDFDNDAGIIDALAVTSTHAARI